MANTNPVSAKLGSHLGNRILWFDGSMTVEPDTILDFMRPNVKLHVTEVTPEISSFNRLADTPIDVKRKLDASGIQPDIWLIPSHYLEIDLERYFDMKLNEWSGAERDIRRKRVDVELAAFQAVGKEIILRLMIYIIDTLTENNSVWGIGRGSSVSCFILYLIGVHDIDSVEYDLDFTDFMKNA